MRLNAPRPMPHRQAVQMGGLKKILRKAAGPVLAAGAVAAGQPQLAVAAYNAGNAATKKKRKAVEAPAEPVPASWFDTLTTGDRNALMIGGAVVGTLLLSRLLSPGRR